MDLFHYDGLTGEFLGQTQARPDPMTPGSFLIPANATNKTPHVVGANQANVFNSALNEWELKPDYRGITYYNKTTGDEVFFNLGDTPGADVQDTYPAALKAAEDEAIRVNAIKQEAQQRIIKLIPGADVSNYLIKELNLLMQDNGLNDILLHGGTLTATQQNLKVFFRGLKADIDAIRSLSDDAETNGHTLDQFVIDLDAAGF